MPKTWRTCELTQDCAYGWTPANVEKFLNGWTVVKDYAYILHNKDLKDDMSTPRDDHTHVMLRFHSPVPTTAIIARAKAVGLPEDCITENRIEKMKSWSGALNYLTHRDEHKPWKHVYSVDEVHSNFDWQLDAEAAHQKKQLRSSDARAKEIVEAIDTGIIREYNIHKHLTIWEQVQYSAHISKAFKAYIDREKQKGEREMEVMFISGASGVGKDAFAVDFAKKNGMDYYRTNNNPEHPFDDYKGQPCVIWSDARDNVFRPAELFALLDNHWKSSQKARYSDINLDCKFLIITSVKPLDEWYSQSFSEEEEPRKQLYRRIKAWFEVGQTEIVCKAYNQATNSYVRVYSLPNTFSHSSDFLDTADKQLAFMGNLLKGYSDALTDLTTYAKQNHPEEYHAYNNSVKPLTRDELISKLNGSPEELRELIEFRPSDDHTPWDAPDFSEEDDIKGGVPF